MNKKRNDNLNPNGTLDDLKIHIPSHIFQVAQLTRQGEGFSEYCAGYLVDGWLYLQKKKGNNEQKYFNLIFPLIRRTTSHFKVLPSDFPNSHSLHRENCFTQS
jgi:hypothetical protein